MVMSPVTAAACRMCIHADDLASGQFARVLGETDDKSADKVRRVVFRSGKVYYELRKARREMGK